MSSRTEDIARLKAHCSLLRGLPDRVVESLYCDFCAEDGWADLNWPYYRTSPIPRSYLEVFTDHCISLWAGGEEQ